MCRSSSTTAGVLSRSSAVVSASSLVSPTTARSSSASSSNRSPCRTTAWSSAITIVIGERRHSALDCGQGALAR